MAAAAVSISADQLRKYLPNLTLLEQHTQYSADHWDAKRRGDPYDTQVHGLYDPLDPLAVRHVCTGACTLIQSMTGQPIFICVKTQRVHICSGVYCTERIFAHGNWICPISCKVKDGDRISEEAQYGEAFKSVAAVDPLDPTTLMQNRERLARNLTDDIKCETLKVITGLLQKASGIVRSVLTSDERRKHDRDLIDAEYKRIAAAATTQFTNLKSMKAHSVSAMDHVGALMCAANRLKKANVMPQPSAQGVESVTAHVAVLLWMRFEPLFCNGENQPLAKRVRDACMQAIESGVKKDVHVPHENYTFGKDSKYTFDMHVISTMYACAYGIATKERTFIRPFKALADYIPGIGILDYLPGRNRGLFQKVDAVLHDHVKALTGFPAIDISEGLVPPLF